MVRWPAQGINLVMLESKWRVCSWEALLSSWVTDLGLHNHSRPGFYPPSLSTPEGNRIGHIVCYEVEKTLLPHPSTWVLECVLNSTHHNSDCAHAYTCTQMRSCVLSTLGSQRETPAGRAIDAFVTGWLFPIGEGGVGRREWAVHKLHP